MAEQRTHRKVNFGETSPFIPTIAYLGKPAKSGPDRAHINFWPIITESAIFDLEPIPYSTFTVPLLLR